MMYGYIFFFIIDFLVRLSCRLNSFFFPLRWIKIGNTVSEGYRMEFLSATDTVADINWPIRDHNLFVTEVSVSSLADQKQ